LTQLQIALTKSERNPDENIHGDRSGARHYSFVSLEKARKIIVDADNDLFGREIQRAVVSNLENTGHTIMHTRREAEARIRVSMTNPNKYTVDYLSEDMI
jgi:hypothetical protein